MAEGVLEERIKKAVQLAKSKDVKAVRYCQFYFDFYLPYETHDLNSKEQFSYNEVFNKMQEGGINMSNEGLVWRVNL